MPLYLAAEGGHTDVVKLLLDERVQSKINQYTLRISTGRRGHVGIVHCIRQGNKWKCHVEQEENPPNEPVMEVNARLIYGETVEDISISTTVN